MKEKKLTSSKDSNVCSVRGKHLSQWKHEQFNIWHKQINKKITHKSNKFLSRVIYFFYEKLNENLRCCKKTKAQTPPTGYVITSVSIYSDKSILKHLFLGCYEAISEIQRRVGRDEKKKRGGGNRRVLVLIWEVKAKKVWPCPLWALSWNAMWTLRRQLLEPCQGPLTPRPFLFLCLCPQTQQCGRTCCLHPPLPQPQTSPAASPFLRFALILSLSLTCSLWHTHGHGSTEDTC